MWGPMSVDDVGSFQPFSLRAYRSRGATFWMMTDFVWVIGYLVGISVRKDVEESDTLDGHGSVRGFLL